MVQFPARAVWVGAAATVVAAGAWIGELARGMREDEPAALVGDAWEVRALSRVLADDSASPMAWERASWRIVEIGGGPHEHPEVTALLVARMDQLAERDPVRAPSLARDLGAWDAVGGLDAIRRQWRRCHDAPAAADNGLFASTMSRCVAELTTARARAGDVAALEEYAAWIRDVGPERADWYPEEVFAPLRDHAGEPAMESAAEALFGDPGSPWSGRATRYSDDMASDPLFETPMIRLAGFRRLALRALGDRRRVGTAEVLATGNIRYAWDNGNQSTSPAAPRGAEDWSPPPGILLTVRVCDLRARELSTQPGAPAFGLHWREPLRDVALVAMIAFVSSGGAPAR